MAESQRAHIKFILESGEFGLFVGLLEDLHFEAKNSTPYDLSTEKGRYELAKDVSALANSDGGYIVIGLHDERQRDQPTGRVSALDLFEESASDVGAIRGVIKEYVYPVIRDLEIRWVPTNADQSRGVCYVCVPQQPDEKKLFIIARVFEDSEVQKGVVFGIARRVDAANTPMTANDLYTLIQRGHDPRGQQLTRIEDKLNTLTERLSTRGDVPVDLEALMRKRIDDVLGDL